MNWDSGASRGRRRIKGGRAWLRAGLAMPALAAARANPALRAFYQRLRAAGKAHRVVLTAVLRKLVVLANALVRDNRLWTPRGIAFEE
jgi:transposase